MDTVFFLLFGPPILRYIQDEVQAERDAADHTSNHSDDDHSVPPTGLAVVCGLESIKWVSGEPCFTR